jgi:hypothetical protein
MSDPKRKRNWKKVRPSSLQHAMELCLDHAREVHNRSVERVAELIDANKWTLYKWVAEGALPASRIRPFEFACGCTYVTDYLSTSAHKLVIDMPSGKQVGAQDITELQGSFAESMGLLIKFYAGEAEVAETLGALTDTMSKLGWHRANVERHAEPELALFGSEQ